MRYHLLAIILLAAPSVHARTTPTPATQPVSALNKHGLNPAQQERLSNAIRLSNTKPAEAAAPLLALWSDIRDFDRQSMGVRYGTIVRIMTSVRSKSPEAKAAFAKHREQLETTLNEGKGTWETRMDWVAMNRVLNDEAGTLAWYDKIKGDAAARDDIERNAFELIGILVRAQRRADTGRLFADPVKYANDCFKRAGATDPRHTSSESRESRIRQQSGDLSQIYAGLLAVGRETEAVAVADVVLKHVDDANARRFLVSVALDQGVGAHERHVKWLDEADGKLPTPGRWDTRDPRKELNEALAAKAKREVPAKAAPAALTDAGKITSLLAILETSDATFIRNDTEHDGKEAASHLRTKLKSAGNDVKTVQDFITHVAAKSSSSGKTYKVRTKDGQTVDAADWFRARLAEIEAE